MADGQTSEHAGDVSDVFRRHGAYVCRLLRRFGIAERDLPDACQDVFVVVMRKLPEFEGRAALPTWLYRICLRTASDYRKRAYRRREQPFAEPPEPICQASQAQQQQVREAAQQVERALTTLGDEARAVFVLYELQERAMPEVAAIVGCPLKTAFTRLYAARKKVNAALRRSGLSGAFCLPVGAADRGLHPGLRAVLEQVGSSGTPLQSVGAKLSELGASGALAAGRAGLLTGSKLLGPLSLGALSALCIMSITPAPEGAAFLGDQTDPSVDTPLPPPRFVAVPQARPPRETSPPRARPRRPAPWPLPAAAPTASTAEATTPWIYAEPMAGARGATAPLKPVGLDEVLAATDVRALMRVGPARPAGADQGVVLVPVPPAHRWQRSVTR